MTPRPRKEVDTCTYTGRFAVRLKKLLEKAGMTIEELTEKRGDYYCNESNELSQEGCLPRCVHSGAAVRLSIPYNGVNSK